MKPQSKAKLLTEQIKKDYIKISENCYVDKLIYGILMNGNKLQRRRAAVFKQEMEIIPEPTEEPAQEPTQEPAQEPTEEPTQEPTPRRRLQ